MYTPEYYSEVDGSPIPPLQSLRKKIDRLDVNYAPRRAASDYDTGIPQGGKVARQENTFLVAPGTVGSPTSSSVNWWPYQSWSGTAGFGPATVAAAANGLAQETLAEAAKPTISSLIPTAPSVSNSLVVSPILSATSTPTSTIPTSVAARTSSSSSSSSSALSSASMISISALPPQASGATSVSYAPSGHHHFNIIYLTPLFAAIGLALGALTSILLFRRYRRRSGLSRDDLQAGPRYDEPKPEYAPVFNSAGRVESRSVDEEKESQKPVPPRVAEPGPSRHLTVSGVRSGPSPVRSNTDPAVQSFLALPDLCSRPESASVYSASTRPNSRATYVPDEPYDPRRNSSFRRSLAESVASNSRLAERYLESRANDLRSVGDAIAEDEDGDTGVHTPLLDDCPDLADESSGPGFRIIQEDAPHVGSSDYSARASRDDFVASPEAEPASNWLAWTRSWSATSLANRSEYADRYTPVPKRKAPSGKRGMASRSTSPSPIHPTARSRSTSRGAPRRSFSRSDLPASPPLVSSPPLNAILAFGRSQERLTFPQPPAPAPLRVDKTRRATRKLHSAHPAPLPYPSSADGSPYRGRLKKPVPSKREGGRVERGRSDASEELLRPSKIALSPGERRAMREGAVGRVDDIVAKSYASRTVSPMQSEEDLTWMAGIEQRLEG